MLNMFLKILFLAFGFLFYVTAAQAQDYKKNCEVNYETRTTLFHPDPASFSIWQSNYGEGGRQESFASLSLPVDGSQGAVAAGTVRESAEAKPDLLLVQVDVRGRTVWERKIAIEGLSEVIKILPLGGGYFVMANAGGSVWLGFFDESGKLRGMKVIAPKTGQLRARDVVPSADDKGMILALTRENSLGSGKNRTIKMEGSLYKIDTAGNLIWQRSYAAGSQSEILGLSKATFENDQLGYIATGYIENKFEKKLAIVMRVDADGSLVWLQEYERGLQSQMNVAAGYHKKYILAFGDVRPANAGPVGAWLMLLDAANGVTRWQRYYNGETGAHDYRARGLYVNKDGLITLLMQAQVPEGYKPPEALDESDQNKPEDAIVGNIVIPELTNYAHVLTLSPRGVTLAGDSYYQGRGALVSQIIEGPAGERMIAGHIEAEASIASVARGFVPDWDRDFAYGPDLPKPISAQNGADLPKPNLPQADLTEKTKSGLVLLTQKLRAQSAENQTDSDNILKNVQQNSESKLGFNKKFSENGWIVTGVAPEPYEDPCKTPRIDIPQ